jgi:hypothetical protein
MAAGISFVPDIVRTFLSKDCLALPAEFLAMARFPGWSFLNIEDAPWALLDGIWRGKSLLAVFAARVHFRQSGDQDRRDLGTRCQICARWWLGFLVICLANKNLGWRWKACWMDGKTVS